MNLLHTGIARLTWYQKKPQTLSSSRIFISVNVFDMISTKTSLSSWRTHLFWNFKYNSVHLSYFLWQWGGNHVFLLFHRPQAQRYEYICLFYLQESTRIISKLTLQTTNGNFLIFFPTNGFFSHLLYVSVILTTFYRL